MANIKEEYLTSAEAARILGLHPFAIQRLIRRGVLPAEKLANRWLIARSCIEDFAVDYKPQRGRPRKPPTTIRREGADESGAL